MNEMKINPYPQKARSGKIVAGLILLTVGVILLLKQLGYLFPAWLISWPMLLIVIGLFIGAKHQFRNPGWIIMVAIGTIFLIDRYFDPRINIKLFWPVLIIILGLWMIFGRSRKRHNWSGEYDGNFTPPLANQNIAGTPESQGLGAPTTATNKNDYLDSVSVFGGVKKTIVSKNFQGGEIVTFLGGAEINLSQADIQGVVSLDVTQVMGGTKIVVPPHWDVVSEMVAVFGGIDDKRIMHPGSINPEKVLVIKGTSVFGGIDIRSF